METDQLYKRLLHDVISVCGTTMGALYLTSADGRTLVLHTDEGLDELWREWTREIPIRTGIGAGVCGEAVALRQVSIAPALEDSKFEGFRRVARMVGIGAAWSMPLLSLDGCALGSLTVLYDGARVPTEAEIAAVGRIARRVARLIESRKRQYLAQPQSDRLWVSAYHRL